jgi:hypothetical protein
MEKKDHWKKVFDSDYLGACDLEDGQDLKATIEQVQVQKIKNTQGAEEERNVAVFKDKAVKPMILNVTNCKILKKFAGSPFIQDWAGLSILIYVKKDVKAFGDITEGLRIRDYQPRGREELTPAHQAWPNAVTYVGLGKSIEDIKKKYDLSKPNEKKLLSEAAKAKKAEPGQTETDKADVGLPQPGKDLFNTK